MEAGIRDEHQGDTRSQKITRLEIREGEHAEIVINTPGKKVNVLTRECFAELHDHFAILKAKPQIKSLLIYSSKEGNFFAGADIEEILHMKTKEEAFSMIQQVQDLFDELDELPQLTVAAIHGACMGGGLELSLACDYRVCSTSEKTKMALPEVMIGVLPGAGGTQRLPRLIPFLESVKMITSGAAVDARKAVKLGLVDDAIPEERMLEVCRRKIRDGSFHRILRKRALFDRLLEWSPLRKMICSQARKQILAKTKGFYPAPLKALEVIEKTYGGELKAGLLVEARGFVELAISKEAKNLMGLFFNTEELKKSRGVPSAEAKDFQPAKVTEIGVLGAGIMGGGIAAVASKRGISVRLKDVSQVSIETALKTAQKLFDRDLQKRKIERSEFEKRRFRISSTTDWTGFRHLPLVIEAVVEKMEIKKQVLRELEALVSKDCLIASNTSSLSISEMASVLKKPERMVGLHFFNPVPLMPLVEVVRAEQSSAEAVVQAVSFAKALGKTVIVVKDRPGFLINRILMPFLIEAGHLRQDGYSIEQVDRAATLFGMPMGPFRLLDEIGLDTGAKVADTISSAYPHMKVLPMIHDMVKKDYLGKKNSQGFYEYDARGKEKGVRQEFVSSALDPSDATTKIIQDRLILPMVTEAVMALEEGIIESPRDLDLGLIYGIGFPPFRGGLLKWVSEEGERSILDRFHVIHNATKGRLVIPKELSHRAKSETSYYSKTA
jgi:3-hydroxyacyl-CoA dehydrogenase/enoyl-CoA hydratase/3-hydroxybutyryl-CoA epimerase